jgi:hypothetical protein
VRKAAQAVRADHAMAGDHDRQPVVAAGLAHRSGLRLQEFRKRAVGKRLSPRDLAQGGPQPLLKRRAFDEKRQVEARVRIVAVALELARGALGKQVFGRNA